MPTFYVEGVEGELPPEVVAAIDAVESLLRRYRWTPFPLLGDESRHGLATQCALAALEASGHGLLKDD